MYSLELMNERRVRVVRTRIWVVPGLNLSPVTSYPKRDCS
jgi:hypothetical protein